MNKKYKEALERCKKEFNFNNLAYSHEEIKQILEHIFPELKESEESEIIDALKIAVCSYCSPNHNYVNTIPKGRLITWLEKQGEQKPTDEPKQQWSCEDENMFACLWGILNWVERSNHSLAKNVGKYIEWLQSLKQRLNGYE